MFLFTDALGRTRTLIFQTLCDPPLVLPSSSSSSNTHLLGGPRRAEGDDDDNVEPGAAATTAAAAAAATGAATTTAISVAGIRQVVELVGPCEDGTTLTMSTTGTKSRDGDIIGSGTPVSTVRNCGSLAAGRGQPLFVWDSALSGSFVVIGGGGGVVAVISGGAHPPDSIGELSVAEILYRTCALGVTNLHSPTCLSI
jgi:hypothetical protein